jgi:hypothetical protein
MISTRPTLCFYYVKVSTMTPSGSQNRDNSWHHYFTVGPRPTMARGGFRTGEEAAKSLIKAFAPFMHMTEPELVRVENVSPGMEDDSKFDQAGYISPRPIHTKE